jgi:hypothetical protein
MNQDLYITTAVLQSFPTVSKRRNGKLSTQTNSGSTTEGKVAHTCVALLSSLGTKENTIEVKELLS